MAKCPGWLEVEALRSTGLASTSDPGHKKMTSRQQVEEVIWKTSRERRSLAACCMFLGVLLGQVRVKRP